MVTFSLTQTIVSLQIVIGSSDLPEKLPPGIDLELPAAPGPGPAFLPRHGAPGLLKQIAALAQDQPEQAASLLKEWISDRNGRLLFDGEIPPWEEGSSTSPVEIPSTEQTLSAWALSLPQGFLIRAFRDLSNIPLNGSHPWIWAPEFESAALQSLESAIEMGDRQTASILLRRKGLASQIPAELLSWIQRTESAETLFQSTIDLTPLVPAAIDRLKTQNWLIRKIPFEIPPTVADPGQSNQLNTLKARRSPLSAVHGLLRNRVLLVAEDRQVLAFDDSGNQLWAWPETKTNRLPDRHPPANGIRNAISSGNDVLFMLRSARSYQPPNTNLAIEAESEKHLGWIEGHILNLESPQSKPSNSWTLPLAQEGFTLLPTPLWRGNRLYLLATRGFREVETWIFSFDTDRKRENWRRKLETRRIDVHSFHDLRQLIGQSQISQHGSILSIDRSYGVVDRVCAHTGEHVSTLITPRFHLAEQPLSLRVHWGELRLQGFPWPRGKNLPISVIVPAQNLRICIPPDSRMLFGLDLTDGSARWQHEVSPGESILGLTSDLQGIWLADMHIHRAKHVLGVRRVRLNGAEEPNSDLELPLGSEPRVGVTSTNGATVEPKQLRPLLLGELRYFSDQLLVPTVAGLEWFNLQTADSSRFLPWPAQSTGGNLFSWSQDYSRWGVFHRGDVSRRTTSAIEIWSAQAFTNDKPGQN
ncbi:MAG: hypothetical protein CBC13_07195 [Planctomycetia bacterium TMED53]|nr:MAG: hypothetical protein CBC13_07195 [Planctomycetia bacterium TMED53]